MLPASSGAGLYNGRVSARPSVSKRRVTECGAAVQDCCATFCYPMLRNIAILG